ncbi:MAG: hypothetical protein WA715_17705 [Candidatus Acidiferrum sp.]|jgi:hypothetical protein
MIISTPRFPTSIAATIALFALTYGITMVFLLHRYEAYWAFVLGLSFAIYSFVPKLLEEPEIKPEMYTLFGSMVWSVDETPASRDASNSSVLGARLKCSQYRRKENLRAKAREGYCPVGDQKSLRSQFYRWIKKTFHGRFSRARFQG